jgi:Ser/Thr protein kinase RdoA (MazF antagonist)
MDYMILKTIITSIAAASIALAAPAYADNGKTLCASTGNGTTHAQAICPQAPGSHTQAHAAHLVPRPYSGKP